MNPLCNVSESPQSGTVRRRWALSFCLGGCRSTDEEDYNMHCMPMVVLLNLGEDALVVRRQGYEGVPQNTGLPEWLTDGERGQSDAHTD